MPQYSYVLQKDLHFSDLHFIAKEGDIFVFTPPERLVVYRSGEIVIQMGVSKASIDGFCIAGIVRRYAPETPAAPEEVSKAVAIVDPDPDPEPIPEENVPIKVEEESLEDLQTHIDEESAPELPPTEETAPVVKAKRGGRRKATEDVKQG